jgi:hypothetical protein
MALLSRAAPACHSPGRFEFRPEGGAATCAAARLKIHETQIFTRISWKTMVKMSMPLTMATA